MNNDGLATISHGALAAGINPRGAELSRLTWNGQCELLWPGDANIWSGTRIIQVCMWYTRGGAKVSDTVCSNAASTGGSWLSGPVKTMSVWDSLDPNAPHTIFNFSKVGINP